MALNEVEILGGKAVIFQNDFEIWQFRCWVSSEKQYVRKSLRTRDRNQAVSLAVDLYIAILPFLGHKRSQISVGDDYTIVVGRYKTIETHLRHFVRYIGKKIKITDLDSNFLNKHWLMAKKSTM
jgi:hypothetical protein